MGVEMRKIANMLFAAALVGASAAATAEEGIPSSGVFKTGDELYAACSSDDEAELDQCYWYIMAVWDTMVFYADIDLTDRYACLSDDSTKVGEMREVVVASLGKDDRTKSAVSMVFNALTDGYPCE